MYIYVCMYEELLVDILVIRNLSFTCTKCSGLVQGEPHDTVCVCIESKYCQWPTPHGYWYLSIRHSAVFRMVLSTSLWSKKGSISFKTAYIEITLIVMYMVVCMADSWPINCFPTNCLVDCSCIGVE